MADRAAGGRHLLAPLNGSIASLANTGTGTNNLRRRLNINQPWSALAPYVGKSGLTVTARNPSNASQTQTRNVQSVSSTLGRIDVTQSFSTSPAITSGWLFTLNVPAALSTFPNCIPVQPVFTPPTVFDNVFWDNRAGRSDGGFVRGIGLPGDPAAINHWDLGAYGVAPANALKPVKNDIQDLTGHTNYNNRGNVSIDPGCRRRTTRPSGWRRSAAIRTSSATPSSPSTCRRRGWATTSSRPPRRPAPPG